MKRRLAFAVAFCMMFTSAWSADLVAHAEETSVDITDGMIAYYDFENAEEGATTVANKVGDGTTYTGTLLDVASLGTLDGWNGGTCLDVTQSNNDGLSIPSIINTKNEQDYSISMWYKRANSSKAILAQQINTGAVTGRSLLFIDEDAKYGTYIDQEDKKVTTALTAGSDGYGWQHVTWVFDYDADSTSYKITFYANGADAGEVSLNTANITGSGITDLYIGRHKNADDNTNLNGYVDEVRVYDCAVSADQAKAIYDYNDLGARGLTVTAPSKTNYTVGDTLDLTGLVVAKTYNNGSSVEVADYTTDAADVNMAEAGTKTITVTAEGYTTTFTITVSEPLADYTAVDAALAKVPEDLSIYTAETAKAVKDAVAAVVRDKKDTEQAAVDAMAKAIEDAVAALEEKAADYTAVDAALAKVPENLSIYTAETAKAVNDAVAAVVRDKKITEQAAVDAMAQAIEAAVAGLEKTKEQLQAEADQQAAAAVKEMIDAIKDASLENEAQIKAAREAYDKLTDAQKALVDNLELLTAAEKRIEEATKKPVPKKGSVYTDAKGILQYRVTKSSETNGTVAVAKILKKNSKKVTIPDTVILDGYTFKVTQIAAKTFKNCKKLKKVVIGKNVKKVGKQAFKGIKKSCKIQVSKKMSAKQFKAVKKALKKAGVTGKISKK